MRDRLQLALRRVVPACLATLALATAGGGAGAGGAATVAPAGTPPRTAAAPRTPPPPTDAAKSPARRPGLEASPGWYYVVDPESASVVLGRRLNAPLVRQGFHGGCASMEDLGRAACRALHHSSRDSLLTLCVADTEFRDILWREFPQSRPITGLTWRDGWTSLTQRLQSGVHGAIAQYAGQDWKFVRFQSDSVAQFKNFRLHLNLRMLAVDDQGQTVEMRWLRAVAERKGRFKIYSTDD